MLAAPVMQVMEQERTGELGPDAVLDGGDNDTERRCTYLEAALALAGGLEAAALETLLKAAKPGMQVGRRWPNSVSNKNVDGMQPLITALVLFILTTGEESCSAEEDIQGAQGAVLQRCEHEIAQGRSTRANLETNPFMYQRQVLAYLAGHRSDFMADHGKALLELATSGAATAVSAARRYRLAFVRAMALALVQSPDGLDPGSAGATVLPQIISEIVLSLKVRHRWTCLIPVEQWSAPVWCMHALVDTLAP